VSSAESGSPASVEEVIWGSGCVRSFWIDVRKILNSGMLLAGGMRSCSQNLGFKAVTRKIFQNKDLAAGSERRTSGVGAGWDERRPRMGTVWLFSRARVKVTCHRNSIFACGKLPKNETAGVTPARKGDV
jgi:hypothetical protein